MFHELFLMYVGNSKILIFVASIKSRKKNLNFVLHCTQFVCFFPEGGGLNKEGIYLKLTEKKN